MRLLLSDALKIYPLSLSRIVAGQNGLRKEITSVNIVEVPEVARWMRGGELLFTSGFAFHGDEHKGVEMLRDLAEHQVTAMAIKPGKHLTSIPPEMIVAADELGFPLLEVPHNLPFMDFMEPILEKLINEQLFALKRVEEIHANLLEALLTGEGLGKICSTLSQMIRNPSFVVDPKGDILASSFKNKSLLTEYDRFFSKDISRLHEQALHSLQAHSWNKLPTMETGDDYILVPVNTSGRRAAYLIAHACNNTFANTDYIALEHASTLVSIILMQEQSILEKEWQLKGECLEDLITHNYSDEDMMTRRACYYHIDFHQPFVIFAIEIDHFVSSIEEKNWKLKEEKIHGIKEEILGEIRHSITLFHRPVIMLSKSDHVAVLTNIHSKEDMDKCRALVYSTIQDLNTRFVMLNFSAGISRVHKSLADAAASYEEALRALRCAPRLNTNEKVIAFEDLGAFHFFYELKDSPTTQTFLQERMNTLLAYDKDKNGELINTLSAYFCNNQNMRKTAETLFMHKNSVAYRLRLVEELTGLKLSDSESAFQLQLCLKLMEVL